MSKILLIYASIHHGNTKKLVDALASKFEIETVDAEGKERMVTCHYIDIE